ncbi:MAG: HAD-IC family P-type ATPase, partial [Acholeplasmataceae bacterium]
MKEYYQKESQEIINDLNSNLLGLNKKEVLKRLNNDGFNELDKVKKRNIFLKFLDQFNDFMIIILLIAAVIAIIFSIINQSNDELIEAFIILAIVLINAFLGLFQELKSEKALDEIKSLSSPHILVLRNNKESIIETKELVKGDIVLLKTGDIIPADIRIIKSNNLSIDESILTGESLPVNKIEESLKGTKSLGDQINLGFMSTIVTRGTGIGIVIKTGMETEIGKISSLLNDAKPKDTPLQKNISDLGQKLVYLILSIVVLIFLVQFIRDLLNNDLDLIKSLMISITLAVAAIPEGLPAIVTIILSLGMQRLVKKGAILKSLPAVETLGSTSIICSDKTGTLTQNKMSIENIYFYRNELNT